MPNLFRHPTGHSDVHGAHLACGVLKQVQHDVIFLIFQTHRYEKSLANFNHDFSGLQKT